MASFFVFKIRTECPECGEGMVPPGRAKASPATAAQSVLPVKPEIGKASSGFASFLAKMNLVEDRRAAASIRRRASGSQRQLGPQRPAVRVRPPRSDPRGAGYEVAFR